MSAEFYWPKEIIRLAQTQGLGIRFCLFNERNYDIRWPWVWLWGVGNRGGGDWSLHCILLYLHESILSALAVLYKMDGSLMNLSSSWHFCFVEFLLYHLPRIAPLHPPGMAPVHTHLPFRIRLYPRPPHSASFANSIYPFLRSTQDLNCFLSLFFYVLMSP